MSIGFEELLGLLFFIFFIVVPLLSRKNKPTATTRRPTSPGHGPKQAGAGGPPAAPGQAARAPRAEPASFRELLEEVRRRVAEAEAQASSAGAPQSGGHPVPAPGAAPRSSPAPVAAGTQGRPGGLVKSDPFGGGLVTGHPRSAALGREGPAGPIPESAPLEVSRRRVRSRKALGGPEADVVTAGVQPTVRPTKGPAAARLGAPTPQGPRFLGMARGDLVRGMIWHEVLSEPAAYKRLRRTRSRPR